MRYIILSVCSVFAKSTKWRISDPVIKKKKISPVPKSPDNTCLLYVKKTHPRLGHAWAPLSWCLIMFQHFWFFSIVLQKIQINTTTCSLEFNYGTGMWYRNCVIPYWFLVQTCGVEGDPTHVPLVRKLHIRPNKARMRLGYSGPPKPLLKTGMKDMSYIMVRRVLDKWLQRLTANANV
jgi:hypothetical protein